LNFLSFISQVEEIDKMIDIEVTRDTKPLKNTGYMGNTCEKDMGNEVKWDTKPLKNTWEETSDAREQPAVKDM
jgi:hypothetical protein